MNPHLEKRIADARQMGFRVTVDREQMGQGEWTTIVVVEHCFGLIGTGIPDRLSLEEIDHVFNNLCQWASKGRWKFKLSAWHRTHAGYRQPECMKRQTVP